MVSAMSANAVRSDWVGRVIDGKFTLLDWLGGSERTGVFLTELPGEPAQKAVIKLIPSDTEAEDRLDGWTHSGRLSHPHLVRVLHTGHCEIDSTLLIYAVSEYADEVLSEILSSRALTPEEVKDLLDPVLDALSYIHAQGFVHGRLKPSNILAVGEVLKLSSDSLVAVGSPPGYGSALTAYDAPERDQGELLPASDVWSLGMTLVVAITDSLPHWDRWSGSAPVVPDSIPEPFASVVHGCLELDPARRFTIAEVRRSLDFSTSAPVTPAEPAAAAHKTPLPEPATGGEPVAAPEPVSQEPSPPVPVHWSESEPSTPRFSKYHLRILVIALAVIAFLMFFALHKHKPQPSPNAQQATADDNAPPTPVKPPAGIAVPKKSGSPHMASSSASPPETPPPGSPAMSGPTVKGQVAQRAMPNVLPAASHSIHGTVRVQIRLSVGSAGNVSSASFDSAGPSRYFSKIAMQAAEQWKFTPAQTNGQPAPSVWVLKFRFTRDGVDVSPSEQTP